MKLQFKENKYRGKLITFCGLDGSGKTTLINLLSNYLKESGLDFELTKQPTKTMRKNPLFRKAIDEPFSDDVDYREISYMCAINKSQHTRLVIEPLLSQGKIVISDRYFYSSLANLEAYGFNEDEKIYSMSNEIIQPDISFFLDVPVDIAINRIRNRESEKNRYIDTILQEKLRIIYKQISSDNNGYIIDCSVSVDKSFDSILERVKSVLK